MTTLDNFEVQTSYNYEESTEWNYTAEHMCFFGKYQELRASLDYTYHQNYTKERQLFQDEIIKKYSSSIVWDAEGFIGSIPEKPWCVFTAGAMGAGKGHTITTLKNSGRFPLVSFVQVDPDEIRRDFPEWPEYATRDSLKAGELTMREAGYIAEILQLKALEEGKNVLVDGSLRDYEWYKGDFERKRNLYKNIKLAIIHIQAPTDAIFDRARKRGKETGRVVPEELISLSIEQCEKSVKVLAPRVDFFCQILNAPQSEDVELIIPDLSWDTFSQVWSQRLVRKKVGLVNRMSALPMRIRRRLKTSNLSRESVYNLSTQLEEGRVTYEEKEPQC